MKNARLIVAILTSIAQVVTIVAIILWLLPRFDIFIPVWGIFLICLAFGIYAVTLYRVGSRTLTQKVSPGATTMTGTRGKAATRLAPEGYIKIEGELWEARSESGIIPVGTEILVVSQQGLKLIVRSSRSLVGSDRNNLS